MVNSINVCVDYLLENHNVNADGDNKPKEVDGKVAISGQKIKFSILEKIKQDTIKNGINSVVSSGDCKTGDIVNDLASDFGGYMLTDKGSNSNKRKSTIECGYTVSRKSKGFFDDMFVRFENYKNSKENEKQRINEKTYSIKDELSVNLRLNVDEVSTTKHFIINDNKFVKEISVLRVNDDEKINRIKLFINATNGLYGLANQSRNAVNNKPKKYFIAFDSEKFFVKYFELTENERIFYLKELDRRGVVYFEGDSENKCGLTVDEAIQKSIEYVRNNKDLFLQVNYNKDLIDKIDSSKPF